MWLRQSDAAGNQIIIHADKLASPELVLDGVILFFFNGLDQFTSRIDARTARLDNGEWLIQDGMRWRPDRAGADVSRELRLPTQLTPRKIEESFASPDTMSFWELPGFIALLRAIRLSGATSPALFQRAAGAAVPVVRDGADRRDLQPAHAAPRRRRR